MVLTEQKRWTFLDRLRIKLTKPKSWLALEEARFSPEGRLERRQKEVYWKPGSSSARALAHLSSTRVAQGFKRHSCQSANYEQLLENSASSAHSLGLQPNLFDVIVLYLGLTTYFGLFGKISGLGIGPIFTLPTLPPPLVASRSFCPDDKKLWGLSRTLDSRSLEVFPSMKR